MEARKYSSETTNSIINIEEMLKAKLNLPKELEAELITISQRIKLIQERLKRYKNEQNPEKSYFYDFDKEIYSLVDIKDKRQKYNNSDSIITETTYDYSGKTPKAKRIEITTDLIKYCLEKDDASNIIITYTVSNTTYRLIVGNDKLTFSVEKDGQILTHKKSFEVERIDYFGNGYNFALRLDVSPMSCSDFNKQIIFKATNLYFKFLNKVKEELLKSNSSDENREHLTRIKAR